MILAQLLNDAIKLSIRDLRLTALVIGVALVSYLLQSIRVSAVLTIATLLFSVGWFGTKIALLYQVHLHKKLNIKEVPRTFWHYFKKLIPIALVIGLIGLLGLVLVFIVFSRWFFSNLDLDGTLAQDQFAVYLLEAFRSQSIWRAFLSQHWVVRIMVQFSALATIFAKIYARTSVSYMVTEAVPVKRAITQAFKFLVRKLDLIIAFLLLHTILAIIINIINLFVMVQSPSLLGIVLRVIMIAIQAYGVLILDGFILLSVVANHQPIRWVHTLFTSLFSLGARLAHRKR